MNTLYVSPAAVLKDTSPSLRCLCARSDVSVRRSGGLPMAVGGLVTEQLPGLLSREPPVDLGPLLVGLPVPGLGFPLQCLQIRNSSRAQTLPRVEAELDLRLIEPTSVFWRVVHPEPVPDSTTLLLAEVVGQRFAAVYIEVVHYEVDRLSVGVLLHDVPHHTCELRTGTVWGGGGEMPTGFRLHDAKYIRRAAPFVLVVLFGWFPRFRRDRRAHVRMQRDRLLIQAEDGLGGVVGLLVDGQHVFHLLDVRLVQLGDTPHFFPATALTRGFGAKSGLSLGPPWEPTSV